MKNEDSRGLCLPVFLVNKKGWFWLLQAGSNQKS